MMNKPNILLLFTDQQRFDTIAELGNRVIKTPNLDRLVREGTAFTRAYTPSPVCIPARWCMHYGQYSQKSKLHVNAAMPKDNGASLPKILSQNGYYTASIGKCHFTPNRQELRGFDMRLIQEEGNSNPEKDDYCRWLKENAYDYDEPHGTRSEMYYIPQISLHSEKDHPSTWVGDRSIEFINKNSDSKPWMLFSSFIHPHPPFAPPKPWHKLYRALDMPLPFVPKDSDALYTWINRKQNRSKYRDYGIDNNLMRNIKAYYYAAISYVDYQIGRILSSLEETGQLDNTVIVFSSDHGEHLGDYNCFGKRSMHNSSVRIPMIIRGSGFVSNARCNIPVSLVDLLPTFAAISGVDANNLDTDGLNLANIVAGKTNREYVYSQFGKDNLAIYMIACTDWKYIYSAGDNKEFLFDHVHDPQESINKAGFVAESEIKNKLKNVLLTYLKKENASEAYTETEKGLEWREYPRFDLSSLEDPNTGLMIQDHNTLVLDKSGYTK